MESEASQGSSSQNYDVILVITEITLQYDICVYSVDIHSHMIHSPHDSQPNTKPDICHVIVHVVIMFEDLQFGHVS